MNEKPNVKQYKNFIFNSHILIALIMLLKIHKVNLKRNLNEYLEFYDLDRTILKEGNTMIEKEILIPIDSINKHLYNDLYCYFDEIPKKHTAIYKNFERFKDLIRIEKNELNIEIDGRKGQNPDQVVFISKSTNYYDYVEYGEDEEIREVMELRMKFLMDFNQTVTSYFMDKSLKNTRNKTKVEQVVERIKKNIEMKKRNKK